jgi:hypothetical protein
MRHLVSGRAQYESRVVKVYSSQKETIQIDATSFLYLSSIQYS